MEANITIKNYRCFEDTNPLRFKLKEGFISLVGPNNSGKSSFIKLFYELRDLWGKLSLTGNMENCILNEGHKINVNYSGLYDTIEIFTDTNKRPLSIEIEVIPDNPQSDNYLSHINLVSQYNSPSDWGISFFYGPDKKDIEKNQRTVIKPISFFLKKQELEIDCSDFIHLMKNLMKCIYIGPFRNAITEGSGSYYDLDIGTSFIKIWNNWKTGSSKANNTAIQEVIEDIRNIFNFDSLEINASEDLKTLQIVIDGKPYKLNELGSGIAQFIIVLGNVAIKKPSYILIDEPESNLHPSLQIDFLTSLASYATKDIIFATHSVGLARATSEQIYSFQKKDNSTEVKIFEQMTNYAEFIGEMSFSSYKELGFEKILLVEGVKDVKTFQQFLRKLKKDHKIMIIPLGGSQLINGTVETELEELKRITNNISCIVDSERDSEKGSLPKEREEFEKICKKLSFNVCITKRRAIENYLSDTAIQKVFDEKYRSLTPYEKLADCEYPWSKPNNWRIAREMDWEEIKNTDVGKFLELL